MLTENFAAAASRAKCALFGHAWSRAGAGGYRVCTRFACRGRVMRPVRSQSWGGGRG